MKERNSKCETNKKESFEKFIHYPLIVAKDAVEVGTRMATDVDDEGATSDERDERVSYQSAKRKQIISNGQALTSLFATVRFSLLLACLPSG